MTSSSVYLGLSGLLTSSTGHLLIPALSFRCQIWNEGAFCWISSPSSLSSAASEGPAASRRLSPSSPPSWELTSAAWRRARPRQMSTCVFCQTWWFDWRMTRSGSRRLRRAFDFCGQQTWRVALVQRKKMSCRKTTMEVVKNWSQYCFRSQRVYRKWKLNKAGVWTHYKDLTLMW